MKVQLFTEHAGWESNDFTQDNNANLADRKDFIAKVAEAHGVDNDYHAIKGFDCKMRISMIEEGYRQLADLYFEESDGYQYAGTVDKCYKFFRFIHETYAATHSNAAGVQAYGIARVLHSAHKFTDVYKDTPWNLLSANNPASFRQWTGAVAKNELDAGARLVSELLYNGHVDSGVNKYRHTKFLFLGAIDLPDAYTALRSDPALWENARAGMYEIGQLWVGVGHPFKITAVNDYTGDPV